MKLLQSVLVGGLAFFVLRVVGAELPPPNDPIIPPRDPPWGIRPNGGPPLDPDRMPYWTLDSMGPDHPGSVLDPKWSMKLTGGVGNNFNAKIPLGPFGKLTRPSWFQTDMMHGQLVEHEGTTWLKFGQGNTEAEWVQLDGLASHVEGRGSVGPVTDGPIWVTMEMGEDTLHFARDRSPFALARGTAKVGRLSATQAAAPTAPVAARPSLRAPRSYGGVGARLFNGGGRWAAGAGLLAGAVSGAAGSFADELTMKYFPNNDYMGLGANFTAQAGVLGILGGMRLALTAAHPVGFAVTVGTHVLKAQATADLEYYAAKTRGASFPLAARGHIGPSTADKRTAYEMNGRWLSALWAVNE
jgi:hypothetical protein